MLGLKRLTFNNIGRFVTEQTIDFTEFDKLVQVNGSNKNTGGSSGAAKSTIFHALDYLLGICDIPLTGLQSRLTKEKLYAEGEFDVEGVKLTIRRSKKDGLIVKYGDETVSGNVKLAEERLWEIIGIPKKLFKKMVHKKQKEGGFFLNLTAKESYDFLMSSLSLEATSEKTDRIDEDIKAHTSRITQLGHAIAAFTDSIDEFEELQEFEKEPQCSIKDEDFRALVKGIQRANNEIGKIEVERTKMLDDIKIGMPVAPIIQDTEDKTTPKLKEALKQLDEQKGEALMAHLQKKGAVQLAADKIKDKLSKMVSVRSLIERKIEEMQALLREKTHIEDKSCPTCKQSWDSAEALQRVTDIGIIVKSIKNEIIENKTVADTEPSLKEDLERLNAIISKMDQDNGTGEFDSKISQIKERLVKVEAERNSAKVEIEGKYYKELNEYKDKLSEIKASFDMMVEPHQEQIKTLQKEQDRLNADYKYYEDSLASYKSKTAHYEKTLTEKRTNLADALKQRDDHAKHLTVAEETKRLIKTYTLQIFQDTLDYIGSYASDILSEIPNMTNTAIYFEGCKENKSGTIKDEVNAIVNMDGYDNININTLSGGERTVIDLAVDLAVIDMIESKAGKGANFFILDEPFDGLEDINIAQYLEVLKQVDTNKTIIIVDHNPIAKEMITDTILVERDGEQSMVL